MVTEVRLAETATPVVRDEQVARSVKNVFGVYRGTFRENGLRVDFFERGGMLQAYASAEGDKTAASLIDPYLGELENYAREAGFQGKLRIGISR